LVLIHFKGKCPIKMTSHYSINPPSIMHITATPCGVHEMSLSMQHENRLNSIYYIATLNMHKRIHMAGAARSKQNAWISKQKSAKHLLRHTNIRRVYTCVVEPLSKLSAQCFQGTFSSVWEMIINDSIMDVTLP